jgi:hypothetical protein
MRAHHALNTLALFGSFSTLICCALPALFVTLGAGATLAGLVSNVPQLIWLSEHKIVLFILSGILLALAGIARYATRNAPCPADPALAKSCARTRRLSFYLYGFSLTLYAIGFFFAFIAPYLVR